MRKTTGSALITALFIMTLVVITGNLIHFVTQHSLRRATLLDNQYQAYHAAQNMSAIAISFLNSELPSQPNAPTSIDRKAKKFELDLPNGIKIRARLVDAQGHFNINNVLDPTQIPVFTRLLKQMNPRWQPKDIHSILRDIEEWKKTHKNLLMADVSEFRLLPHITAKRYEHLKPFITAFPETIPINLNSAPIEVLSALSPKLNKLFAKQFWKNIHEGDGYADINALNKDPIFRLLHLNHNQYTLQSQYFFLLIDVMIGKHTAHLQQLLKRKIEKSQIKVWVVWEKQ